MMQIVDRCRFMFAAVKAATAAENLRSALAGCNE